MLLGHRALKLKFDPRAKDLGFKARNGPKAGKWSNSWDLGFKTWILASNQGYLRGEGAKKKKKVNKSSMVSGTQCPAWSDS